MRTEGTAGQVLVTLGLVEGMDLALDAVLEAVGPAAEQALPTHSAHGLRWSGMNGREAAMSRGTARAVDHRSRPRPPRWPLEPSMFWAARLVDRHAATASLGGES
jgi:hypothetical protein